MTKDRMKWLGKPCLRRFRVICLRLLTVINREKPSDRPPKIDWERSYEIIALDAWWLCLLLSWWLPKDLSLWIYKVREAWHHNEKRERGDSKGPQCRLLAGLHCMVAQPYPNCVLPSHWWITKTLNKISCVSLAHVFWYIKPCSLMFPKFSLVFSMFSHVFPKFPMFSIVFPCVLHVSHCFFSVF